LDDVRIVCLIFIDKFQSGMNIIHVSAECYPVAKVGGLADVAGALPKYQCQLGHDASLVMPMHRTPFLDTHDWDVIHKGKVFMGAHGFDYTIIRESTSVLGFSLFCIDIHGLLDRDKVYGYDDDPYRFLAFQLAAIDWFKTLDHLPDLIHVHDHHSALIPFLMKHVYENEKLREIKSVLTIHNAQYQGWMDPGFLHFIPHWDDWKTGLLLWEGQINALACGIKCADRVTTVSPNYMRELHDQAHGLSVLIREEFVKCKGILNGIDAVVWNPATDPMLNKNYDQLSVTEGKQKNKEFLCKEWNLDPTLPLIVFIGRLVDDKGADLLPGAISHFLETHPGAASFFILGNGQFNIEKSLEQLSHQWVGYYNSQIRYNETLSHQLYASADFLIMPSRVEPCGLNQMYALRYGTVPMICRTGGLADTVIDVGDQGGVGLCFDRPSVSDILHTFNRAIHLFADKPTMIRLQKNMMSINHSWEASCKEYIDLYLQIH